MCDTDRENEWIYLEYKDKVRRYISGKTFSVQEAEDLHSEVFLKIYQKKEQFDEKKASISTWIYTITRNTVIDYYRRCRPTVELPETITDKEDPFEDIYIEETLEELAQALECLPQRERELVVLHYYEGKTLRDIASQMQMSYANVKIVHKKALKKLQERLVCLSE